MITRSYSLTRHRPGTKYSRGIFEYSRGVLCSVSRSGSLIDTFHHCFSSKTTSDGERDIGRGLGREREIVRDRSPIRPNFKGIFQSKHFDYQLHEKSIYAWWEASGYFKPETTVAAAAKLRSNSNSNNSSSSSSKSNGKFVMPMPPPNVTGQLHMGHAMFLTVQDMMIRYHRMMGKQTLWTPGTDHAGIATQVYIDIMYL